MGKVLLNLKRKRNNSGSTSAYYDFICIDSFNTDYYNYNGQP